MNNNRDFLNFGLSDELVSSLKANGYIVPTDVQKAVIPVIIQGKDVLAKSMTGTGKTAAYSIPIIEKTEVDNNVVQCLIIVPTRELAAQTSEEIQKIGRYCRIKSEAFYGGQEVLTQEKILKGRVHIVVGTPGRILDLLSRNLLDISNLKYFVVDEADRLFEMGFIGELLKIADYLPRKRQTMMFSATITQELISVSESLMHNPIDIDASPESITVNKIDQSYYYINERNKPKLISYLLNNDEVESAIIFCNTKKTSQELADYLRKQKYPAKCLNSDIAQDERNAVISDFRNGDFIFLIATDIAARGLDISDVTHVFNYDIPNTPINYVHRIGRTGRAGKSGTAITFINDYEQKYLAMIEEYLEFSLEKKELSKEIFGNKKILYLNKNKPNTKIDKQVNKTNDENTNIQRLFISAGRKSKISAGDIVGAITAIPLVGGKDIGVIDVYDSYTFVDILNDKAQIVIDSLNEGFIKKKKVKVGFAKDSR